MFPPLTWSLILVHSCSFKHGNFHRKPWWRIQFDLVLSSVATWNPVLDRDSCEPAKTWTVYRISKIDHFVAQDQGFEKEFQSCSWWIAYELWKNSAATYNHDIWHKTSMIWKVCKGRVACGIIVMSIEVWKRVSNFQQACWRITMVKHYCWMKKTCHVRTYLLICFW